MAGIPAMIDVIAAIGFLAVMVFGAIDITSGSKTIGEFMSFFTAMALIFEPLRRLSNVSGKNNVANASLERLFKICSGSIHKQIKLTRLAFIGKPNVGKSTLINSILNESRSITSDKPGTTIDSLEIPFTFKLSLIHI